MAEPKVRKSFLNNRVTNCNQVRHLVLGTYKDYVGENLQLYPEEEQHYAGHSKRE
ncbi:hypothetical protein TIFTF001_052020, partial [Ficus carica]